MERAMRAQHRLQRADAQNRMPNACVCVCTLSARGLMAIINWLGGCACRRCIVVCLDIYISTYETAANYVLFVGFGDISSQPIDAQAGGAI